MLHVLAFWKNTAAQSVAVLGQCLLDHQCLLPGKKKKTSTVIAVHFYYLGDSGREFLSFSLQNNVAVSLESVQGSGVGNSPPVVFLLLIIM